MASFNKEQQEAIDTSSNVDILITAGAGSGKTKTLSERVYQLIKKGEVTPSSILVLTFTNNAAHEMKTRIIKRFAKENDPNADKILSSHIQTFDSFRQYLVSTYAKRLGIADNITIANDSVLFAKEREIVDGLFEEYYKDQDNNRRLFSTISKFSMKNDDIIKSSVISLLGELKKMSTPKRNEFISTYDSKYLSRDFSDNIYHQVCEEIRSNLIVAIYKAHFLQEHYSQINEINGDRLNNLESFFKSPSSFYKDYHGLSFDEDEHIQTLYEMLVKLIDLDDEEFVSESKTFKEKITKTRIKNEDEDEKTRLAAIYKALTTICGNKDGVLKNLADIGTKEQEFSKLDFYKDDIHLLLELALKTESRLNDYEKETNSYSFSDISTMALSLFTDEQYADVAKEVRERFNYIMVDEYQDTNDGQELLINSLLLPKENGERTHLFCVGDAKQSIYRFNNSKVELFRNRQREYLSGQGHKVIPMNKNYRSGKNLLNDINYIFKKYMRLNHGGIDYKDPIEELQYDEKVNLYHEPYDDFGIFRIKDRESEFEGDIKKSHRVNKDEVLYDAKAILSDIQTKIKDGFMVYDRDIGGLRKCRYGDFAILLRVKKDFSLYQKLFNENNVKLNMTNVDNLVSNDIIVVIQSLLKLISFRMNKSQEDAKHLFASVARSYLYEYDDEKIYKLISYRDPDTDSNHQRDDLRLIKEDQIFLTLDTFCKENYTSSFSEIFQNLLVSFPVIENLYKLGNVDDSISKIEALKQIVSSQEQNGIGLSDFISTFKSIIKAKDQLDANTIIRTDDSVDLMTIHGSKGLERKVVYMPVSSNSQTKKNGLSNSSSVFTYSEEFGIQFPYFNYDDFEQYGQCSKTNICSLFSSLIKTQDPDTDEHVRLFYVALTRAENSIYIVGNTKFKKEDLCQMLDNCPNYLKFDSDYINNKIKSKVITEEDYRRYQNAVSDYLRPLPELEEDTMEKNSYLFYVEALKDYRQRLKDKITDSAYKIIENIYDFYEKELAENIDDIDVLTKFYAYSNTPSIMFKYKIETLSDYEEALKNEESLSKDSLQIKGGSDSDDSDEDEGEETKEDDDIEEEADLPSESQEDDRSDEEETVSSDEDTIDLKQKIIDFCKGVCDERCEVINYPPLKEDPKPEEIEEKKRTFVYRFFYKYIQVFDDEKEAVFYKSYKTDEYQDRISFFDQSSFKGITSLSKPVIPDIRIDNSDINFEKRTKKRASKLIIQDEDLPDKEALERGTKLHHLLELVDLNDPHTDFITEKSYKTIIDRVLSLPFFETIKSSQVYQEYGYYDEDLDTTGFIDLLFIKDGEYNIVDYKSSDIDDLAYEDQLHTYQRNIQRIFNISSDHIHLFLLSIGKALIKEVKNK